MDEQWSFVQRKQQLIHAMVCLGCLPAAATLRKAFGCQALYAANSASSLEPANAYQTLSQTDNLLFEVH